MKIAYFILCLSLISGIVSGQSSRTLKTKPPDVKPSADQVMLSGVFTGDVYTNKLLGITIQTPKNWYRAEEKVNQTVLPKGRQIVGESRSEAIGEALDESVAHSRILFQATSLSPGSLGSWAALVSGIERLPTPTSKEEYSEANRQLILGQPNLKITAEPFVKNLGGTEWSALEVENSTSGTKVSQLYLTTVKKGFAIFFIISRIDDTHKGVILDSLNTITFK